MPDLRLIAAFAVACALPAAADADQTLLKTHCAKCHSGNKPKGDFRLQSLGTDATKSNVGLWLKSLKRVSGGEMPPIDASRLSKADRRRLTHYLNRQIRVHFAKAGGAKRIGPRRMNNRELANSLRDVLMIEDVGTHQPIANLLADNLRNGFDTHGDTLGLSQYHLEQYIDAFRKVVDATILTGKPPETRRYRVEAADMRMTSVAQRKRKERANRTRKSIDFLDPKLHVYFTNFEAAPATGRYRIRIRATGVDRGLYDADFTGVYPGDPIQVRVHLGDRMRTFDLPDGKVREIVLDEWIAQGTRLELSYPTDGLRVRGNGNFKFQYAIAHDYIKKHNPALYAKVVNEEVPKARRRNTRPRHWIHWTRYWQGPRPRLFNAEIEGPIYESWPPKRQIALLGKNPKVENAAAILRPIAERAWRRTVREDELAGIARLVRTSAPRLGNAGAFKEGIVAILVSPSFLLINPAAGDPADRFATKLSYFLKSTTPDARLRGVVKRGKLNSYAAVRAEVQRWFERGEADAFLQEFPQAWLQLDRINFMAPDPDRYPLYHRKSLSDDMVAEALRFFRHMVENNRPIPEFLSADYSFVNADLAKVYGLDNVPQDSKLRKYTFTDKRRGGLLGMGAFLTLTADSLTTSPIHRAVYVMENFLGIHPTPPPADVKIVEPDVRQAITIKQVLARHQSDTRCASCHKTIDPYGYAFENFDPMGSWRDHYTMQIAPRPTRKRLLEIEKQDRERAAKGLPPLPRPWNNKPIPIDASSRFRNGTGYRDIIEYRKNLLSRTNRDRFVRCFIMKLLTYANGAEPDNFAEIEKILAKSAENQYRVVDTIAAVVDSPLFREQRAAKTPEANAVPSGKRAQSSRR